MVHSTIRAAPANDSESDRGEFFQVEESGTETHHPAPSESDLQVSSVNPDP